MATTRLTRLRSSPKQNEPEGNQHEPEEKGVRADPTEATRLYQRGVAAARGGQRRIAAGLLTRSVQLDPNNTGTWLWLSGVIDDPHQIAFCLHAVLKLDPANERARKGLRWIEERQLLKGTPQPTPLFSVKVGEPSTKDTEEGARKGDRKGARKGARKDTTEAIRTQGESWWVNWRQWHRDMQRVSLLLWSIPLVLLFLALVLHQAFDMAVSRSTPPPIIVPTVPPPAAPSAPAPAIVALPTMGTEDVPTPEPILSEETTAIRESRAIEYMNRLGPIRQQLRDAIDGYRNATGRPGSTAISHAAAAQNLRTSIDQAYTVLQRSTPPAELESAHEDYLTGLELELEAIDAMVEFYGSYQVEYANLAALRFQEANTYFGRARLQFDARLQQLQASRGVSVHTVR